MQEDGYPDDKLRRVHPRLIVKRTWGGEKPPRPPKKLVRALGEYVDTADAALLAAAIMNLDEDE